MFRALALTFAFAVPASAAPITTVTGTFPTFPAATGSVNVTEAGAAGAPGNLVTFQASGANTTVVDSVAALPANTSSFNFANAVVTTVTTSGGGTSYGLSGGTGLETLNFTNPAAETVTFNLTPTEARVTENNNPFTLLIRGTKTLTRDDAGGYDFGSIGRAFTFELTLTGDVNFLSSFSTTTASSDTGLTGSFVNTAVTLNEPPIGGGAAIPEPATLAALGLLTVGGLARGRRKRA